MTFCVGNESADIPKNSGPPKEELNKIGFMHHYGIVHVNLQLGLFMLIYG